MAGAKGLLSLPLVTERRKLRQLQLNRKLTFGFSPHSAALLVPETLPGPCPGPGTIFQPMFSSTGQLLLRVSPSSAEAPQAAPATYSQSPAGAGTAGTGGHREDPAGTAGTRDGQGGPGRDSRDQGWAGGTKEEQGVQAGTVGTREGMVGIR